MGLFTVILGEARRLTGDLDPAEGLARQGLEITSRSHWPFGTGWAQRVLGRIAQASGDFREAETRFGEALRAFESMEGAYDAHLQEAHRGFRDLAVPRYVELPEKLAVTLGVSLHQP